MIEIIPNFHPAFVHFPIAFVTAAAWLMVMSTAWHGAELKGRHST